MGREMMDGWMDSKNGGTNWDPQQPYNTHHLNAKAPHLSQDFLYTASHALLWLHPFCHCYLSIVSLLHTISSEMPVTFLTSAATNCLLTALSDSISYPLTSVLSPMALIPSFLWSRALKAILLKP